MHHEYHRWYSPTLGRDMELQVFGHAGAKLLVFPTSMGTHREWPDRRMHLVLRDHLENGWLQMYTLDQVHGESWYDDTKHPGARAWRQVQYDEYVYREVVPLTYHRNPNDFFIAAGASFGGYHAMTFGLRHPDVVRRIIGMSARYDITRMTDGYADGTVHMVNPPAFVRHAQSWQVDAWRRQDIIMAIGATDPAVEDNRAMSGVLWERGVGNALRIWDGWAHDWPWWERMIRLYLRGHD
jgi:esterase/lipase superfamily enzyme